MLRKQNTRGRRTPQKLNFLKIKTMIRKVILTMMTAMMALSINAQEITAPKHEVSLRVGTLLGAVNSSCNIFDYEESDRLSPNFALGYLYQLNKTWSVGGAISYMYDRTVEYNLDYHEYPDNMAETYNYTSRRHKYYEHLISFTAQAKAKWARHRIWNMYSRFAIGPAFAKNGDSTVDDKFKVGYMFQVSPVALEIGSQRIRGSLELGLGFEGFVIAGVSYRF